MPTPRTTILVGNPTARTGKARAHIDRAMTLLEEARLEPEFMATLPEGKTVDALADRLDRGDVARVVYLGGDGTFAEAAKAIILNRERSGIDIPLGMLPMGTANDQGRSFGIGSGERAMPQNVRIIADGVEQWLDAGRISAFDENGTFLKQDLWFDNCGLGMSAQVLAARNRDRRIVGRIPVLRTVFRDKMVYTAATMRSLARGFMLQGQRFSVELTIDGDTSQFSRVTDILVLGTILYAGDWIFAPWSKADDGKFEVVVVRGPGDWTAAAIAGHKRNPVTGDDLDVLGVPRRDVLQGKDIEIRLFRPARMRNIPAQIDGEEFVGSDHVHVENIFHALRIIVPEDPHWI